MIRNEVLFTTIIINTFLISFVHWFYQVCVSWQITRSLDNFIIILRKKMKPPKRKFFTHSFTIQLNSRCQVSNLNNKIDQSKVKHSQATPASQPLPFNLFFTATLLFCIAPLSIFIIIVKENIKIVQNYFISSCVLSLW